VALRLQRPLSPKAFLSKTWDDEAGFFIQQLPLLNITGVLIVGRGSVRILLIRKVTNNLFTITL
jgi:hypothetical protein